MAFHQDELRKSPDHQMHPAQRTWPQDFAYHRHMWAEEFDIGSKMPPDEEILKLAPDASQPTAAARLAISRRPCCRAPVVGAAESQLGSGTGKHRACDSRALLLPRSVPDELRRRPDACGRSSRRPHRGGSPRDRRTHPLIRAEQTRVGGWAARRGRLRRERLLTGQPARDSRSARRHA